MTALRPDSRLPIDVHGGLDLESPSGRQVRLGAAGSRLQLALPGWTELRQLGPRSLLARRRSLVTAVTTLKHFGLAIDINVDGRRAFALGTNVQATIFARLLGIQSADIRLSNVIRLLSA